LTDLKEKKFAIFKSDSKQFLELIPSEFVSVKQRIKVRTSAHDKERILAEYMAGKTVLQISRITGIKRPTCHDIIKRYFSSNPMEAHKRVLIGKAKDNYKKFWVEQFGK
jgi:hypothetical protein